MVQGSARLPCPAFCQYDGVVGLKAVPGIVTIMPSTTADEAIADTIVHLAGKTIGFGAVVGIVVAVVM